VRGYASNEDPRKPLTPTLLLWEEGGSLPVSGGGFAWVNPIRKGGSEF